MSRYFGRPTVYMVWKRGLPEQGIVRRLILTIQASLRQSAGARRRKVARPCRGSLALDQSNHARPDYCRFLN